MRDRSQEKNNNVIFINNQLAGGILLIIAVVVLFITLPMTDQEVEPDLEITKVEVVEEKKCLPFEFEYEYQKGNKTRTACDGNDVVRVFSNTLGFERTNIKEIAGRIVQVESGDHVTLESGERYAISNGIDNVWLDEIVKLHLIAFKELDCQLSALKFANGTIAYTKDFHISLTDKKEYILVDKEELLERSKAHEKIANENDEMINYHYGRWAYYDSDNQSECSRDKVWEIEKLG